MKCCDKIDDDWLEGDMWHDNYTTFWYYNEELLVTYQCPHCGKRSKKEVVEVKA